MEINFYMYLFFYLTIFSNIYLEIRIINIINKRNYLYYYLFFNLNIVAYILFIIF
jgi:hypothetical protein